MTDTRVFPKDFNATIRGARVAFRGYRVEASGMRGLFGHPGFVRMVSKVTDIDLTGNRIGAAGLEALAKSPIASQIETLTLGDCDLDPDAIPLLEHFPSLTYLTLDENPLGAEGARRLAAFSRAPALEEVSLSQCAIGEGLAALRGALRAGCFNAGFAEHGGELGTGGPLMPAILLSLHGSALGEKGVAALADWAPSPAQLVLDHTGLDDGALARLAAAGVLARARHVDLRGNPISKAAIERTAFAEGALVKTSLSFDELRSLPKGGRFTTDRLPEGTVFACPYCRQIHDVDQPLCARCGGDVTLDAGFEEPEDYLPRHVQKCPHCGERGAARAMRCHACRSWLPSG